MRTSGIGRSGRLFAATLAISVGSVACVLSANAQQAQPAQSAPEGQFKPATFTGFIPRDKLIDSLALVPPPPAEGSAAYTVDDEARKAAVALRNTARWKLTVRDSDYKSPNVVDAFACTIGIKISAEATPHLYTLMRRSLIDTGLSTYKAKIHYNRTRPFVAAKDDTICSPADADALRKDGSYPSGHAAFGWGWGLILAEMIPDKANAIIQRGYDFGQSRVLCGVHWQSDVNAGRIVASAAVAQLHSNADFLKEFQAAKKEVDAALADAKSAPDCTLEKQAVAK